MRKNVLAVKNISLAEDVLAMGRFLTRKSVSAVLPLFICAGVSAQSLLGLQYPFGLPDFAVTGSAAAMGGSGTAVAEEYFGTSLNPANMAIGGRSAYSAMVSFDFVNIKDGGNSSDVSGYAPKLLSLVLPLGVAGNISFAMQTRYDANINYYMTDVIEDSADRYKANTVELQKAGGLTSWQAGWGYRFKNGFALGVIYERLFFNEEARSTFESVFEYNFEGGNSYRETVNEIKTKAFASDGIRFGTQIPVHEKVTFGAAAEYIFQSGNGTASREYDGKTDAPQEFSVRLPTSINIGLAYRPDGRWLIAADARSTLWDMYDNDGESEENRDLRGTYGLSVGARFIPTANRLSAKYWEKIHYSAGGKYNMLPIDGSREWALSAGTGLPIPNDGGVIDIVFEFGSRTDALYPKYSENTMKFLLGINGGRNWFQKDTRKY